MREPLAVLLLAGIELNKQDRVRLAAYEFFQRRLEHRDLAGKFDHGAVYQFDRDRPGFHEMLGRIHRFIEAPEVACGDHPLAEHGP